MPAIDDLLTEEQARERWCPFARASGFDGRPSKDDPDRLISPNGPSYNRQFVQDFPARQELMPDGRHTRINATPSACRCIASKCMAWRSVDSAGFCGLAGRPAIDAFKS